MKITKAQAAEAVKLFGKYNDWMDEIDTILNISRAFYDAHENLYSLTNERQRCLYDRCLLGCIFNAGRVQGIREERARRKTSTQRAAAGQKEGAQE